MIVLIGVPINAFIKVSINSTTTTTTTTPPLKVMATVSKRITEKAVCQREDYDHYLVNTTTLSPAVPTNTLKKHNMMTKQMMSKKVQTTTMTLARSTSSTTTRTSRLRLPLRRLRRGGTRKRRT